MQPNQAPRSYNYQAPQPKQAPKSYNHQAVKRSRKLVWMSAGGLVFLFVIAAILYIVFAYLPQTPENRYRRGLGSVGAGLQTLSEGEFLDVISSTSYKGQLTAEVRGPDSLTGQVFSSDITVSQSGQYGDAGIIDNLDLNVNYDTGEGDRGTISGKMETRFLVGQDGSAPKLFLKFSDIVLPDDLKNILSLLDSSGEYDLDEIDGTWYLLDFQKLVDSGDISSDELAELNLDDAFHQDDFQEMYLIFVDSLREYFFTAETDKMVLQMDELLGEEDFKGTQSLKYSVDVNKANLRAYLKKLRSDLAEAEFVKKLSASDPDFDLSEELLDDEAIDEFVDEFAKLNYEIWVDKDTGVMRNLRIMEVDKESSSYGSYFDFGISLRDDNQVIVVDFSGKSFSMLGCYSGIFSLEPDSSSEECPYLFDEEGNITSLKDDPQAVLDYSWRITINISESKISHEAAFLISYSGLTVDISLDVETVGQSGDFEIEAPTDYKEIDLSEVSEVDAVDETTTLYLKLPSWKPIRHSSLTTIDCLTPTS